jgi:16S rRNA (cytosine967-C5)-methyltransferase
VSALAAPASQAEAPRSPPLSAALTLAGTAIASVIAGRSLTDALAGAPADVRPAAMDLAYGAVRHLARYRFFLERLLTRADTDADILGVLLAALHALHARPQSEHMVVDQAVTAVTPIRRGAAKGLVNAVLRNFLRRRGALNAEADRDVSTRYSYPAWWIARLQAAYPRQWEPMLAAGNEHPPMTLRINRRRINLSAYLEQLEHAGMPARALGDSGVMLEQAVPVERLPGFAQGLVSVQDFGAQLAAPLLDAQDGMRVLDACAAPGGKTGHLLELADVALTAIDIDETRLARVRQNLARLGLTAKIVAADCGDAGTSRTWWDGEPYDRILLDAPCSASGVVRRHPDGKWLRRETDLASFAASQSRILETLWRMLGRGGKLLYATCSVFPDENAGRTAAFLETHRDARLLHHPNDGQLLPGRDHDGFYYALLGKQH